MNQELTEIDLFELISAHPAFLDGLDALKTGKYRKFKRLFRKVLEESGIDLIGRECFMLMSNMSIEVEKAVKKSGTTKITPSGEPVTSISKRIKNLTKTVKKFDTFIKSMKLPAKVEDAVKDSLRLCNIVLFKDLKKNKVDIALLTAKWEAHEKIIAEYIKTTPISKDVAFRVRFNWHTAQLKGMAAMGKATLAFGAFLAILGVIGIISKSTEFGNYEGIASLLSLYLFISVMLSGLGVIADLGFAMGWDSGGVLGKDAEPQ